MRTHISSDFLRGLLVACIVRDVGQFLLYFLPINWPWSSVPSDKKWMVMLAALLTIAIYSLVLSAVFWRPASTAKLVCGILIALAVAWIGFHRSFAGSFIVPWTGPPLTAVIALVCVFKLRYDNVA